MFATHERACCLFCLLCISGGGNPFVVQVNSILLTLVFLANHVIVSLQKALITGADSGIGRAVALAYAREGADVAIAYLNEHKDAEVRCHHAICSLPCTLPSTILPSRQAP